VSTVCPPSQVLVLAGSKGGGGGGRKDEPKRRLLFSFAPSCPVRIRMREIVGMPYVRKTAISSDLRETQGISYDARVCQMYCARM
jgi:hypothetical protein